MSPQMPEARAARSSKRLSEITAGEDYLELKCLPGTMPDHVGRLDFLKACERLGIPKEKWPSFGGEVVVLPDGAAQLPGTPPLTCKAMGITARPLIVHFEIFFDLCADDHRTFKTKVKLAWQSYCKENMGPYLKQATKVREFGISIGLLRTRIEHREGKNTIPLSRRYELAAKRYCLGTSWGQLRKGCRNQYSEDRIRKCVESVLSEVGLKSRS